MSKKHVEASLQPALPGFDTLIGQQVIYGQGAHRREMIVECVLAHTLRYGTLYQLRGAGIALRYIGYLGQEFVLVERK